MEANNWGNAGCGKTRLIPRKVNVVQREYKVEYYFSKKTDR